MFILWLCLQGKLLSKIFELCVLHLNSTNSRVRAKFSHLLCLVPWYITVSGLMDMSHAVDVKVCMHQILHTLENLLNSEWHWELHRLFFLYSFLATSCVIWGSLFFSISTNIVWWLLNCSDVRCNIVNVYRLQTRLVMDVALLCLDRRCHLQNNCIICVMYY